ncbi:VOC family protein [Lichenihabitans sp. PAMC28606]|uniref:VOC family protein n=1 Tax=Lichenihabitans sp. PAMC28606 TaxID=2880932 RepID=UPI001D0A812E|nr:VOC family protein [Lichenihabitans sp. PAMC28606]UDL94659.1 VOC family protein [Lichenihabitans sp. PAMC28606]
MAKAIHGMIRVLNEQRSLDFYKQAFGLDVADRFDFGDFVLLYLRNDETAFEVELTVNAARTEPYALGDGFGHFAVSVADIAAEHARLTEAGLNPEPVKELLHEGKMLARFFFVADPDGYRIEVLQRTGRFV